MKRISDNVWVMVGVVALVTMISIVSISQQTHETKSEPVNMVKQVIKEPYIDNSDISPNCNGKSLHIVIDKNGKQHKTYTYNARCDI